MAELAVYIGRIVLSRRAIYRRTKSKCRSFEI